MNQQVEQEISNILDEQIELKNVEQEISNILDEQIELKNTEALAGNTVKEVFHKGAVFGIKLIAKIIALNN